MEFVDFENTYNTSVSGSGQTASPGETFSNPCSITATTLSGSPASGITFVSLDLLSSPIDAQGILVTGSDGSISFTASVKSDASNVDGANDVSYGAGANVEWADFVFYITGS